MDIGWTLLQRDFVHLLKLKLIRSLGIFIYNLVSVGHLSIVISYINWQTDRYSQIRILLEIRVFTNSSKNVVAKGTLQGKNVSKLHGIR